MEVVGVEVIVFAIPEPTERSAYEMCGAIRFYTTVPPLHWPVVTDGRGLGPPCQHPGMTCVRCGMKRHAQWAATCRGG
jgi:hypothetical protein